MRIALVHSFYSSGLPSGENRVVEDQAELLAEHGHDVQLVGVSTDKEQQRPFFRLRSAVRVMRRTGFDPVPILNEFRPEIVHVHNVFPNVGSQWLKRWNGPIVMSIHNFRAGCSNGMLLRDGVICHECIAPTIKWSPAVKHGCYRNSRMATLPVAVSRSGFRDDLIASGLTAVTTSNASDLLFRQMTDGEIPSVVIPNFVVDHTVARPGGIGERRGWIVASRLSAEKGVAELADDWPAVEELLVIGDGPDLTRVRRAADGKPGIQLVPAMSRSEMRKAFTRRLGLIFPSRWHEVAPQVVVEAMCAGLPIVAFAENDIASLVTEAGAGESYSGATDLRRALHDVSGEWSTYSANARLKYETEWTPTSWLNRTMRLYAQEVGK